VTVLRVSVLGGMAVECDGTELPVPPSGRPWSLLAYLALNPGRHARAELAARFWPDVLDSSARASLRSAVWALRRALGAAGGAWLLAERDSVGLDEPRGLWVDAIEFERLIARGELLGAVGLCRGPLLAGFEDEWVLGARDAHRERLLGVLEQLACAAEQTGDAQGALEWTRRQIALDPLGEESHRRLISRLAGGGDRAAALVVYRVFSERLRRELGVAPSASTRELIEDLREDDPPAAPVAPAVTPARTAAPLLSASTPVPASAAKAGLASDGGMVGRDAELDDLRAILGESMTGRGAVVIVRGEAGIGKTRLARELLAGAARDGVRTADCGGLDLGGAAPFGLWAELIRGLLVDLPRPPLDAHWPDDLARLSPDAQERLRSGREDRPSATPELERARLFEAIVALVQWAAHDRPLLLLMEDTHIADAPSLELIGYVGRRLAEHAVLLVLTRRELPRRAEADQLEHALRTRGVIARELVLEPLAAEPIERLAGSVAPLGASDLRRVLSTAEGNPLLAVETARALGRGEEPASGLRATLRGTFGALPPQCRGLAEFAAVAARGIDRAEVFALGIEQPAQATTQALDSGLLSFANGRIGFRHALLRDAAYADLPEPQREWLHERWAEALLTCERAGGARRAAEVARHLHLAGRDAEAVEQLARAAEDARALGALAQAAEYLQEAIETLPGRQDLLLELAEIDAWRGRRAEAEAGFELASAAWSGRFPLREARAWLRKARWYHGPICAPSLVVDASRRALELLDAAAGLDAHVERREAIAALAWGEAVAGDVAEAERQLVALHELLAGEPGDDVAAYDVAHARACALMRRGLFRESYAPSIAAGEAVTRTERPDLAYGCWANAAGAAAAAGDLDRAPEFVDRGEAALAGRGLAGLEIQLFSVRAFLLLRMQRFAEAAAVAEREQEIAERLDQPGLLALAAHDRGLCALGAGEFATAARLFGEALEVDGPISRPLTRLARAEALGRDGRAEEAEAEVRATVLEPLRPSDFPETLVPRLTRVQGLIAAVRGERKLAIRRLHEAVAGWEHQLARSRAGDEMATVLADLGRPVVGLIEPERELRRVRDELATLKLPDNEGASHAIVS
jgi:DNA-binding SARP family transcriptional activator/tetratricopeptide (TPR) repeat protein